MAIYPPSVLNTSYQTTNSLIALYGAEGMTLGFGQFSNIPTDPNYNSGVFASAAAFFATIVDRGFFTGSTLKRYYTPAQAAFLYSQPSVAFSENGNIQTINLIEYRLRTEGITTGYFAAGGTVHGPGEDSCTILDNLSADGYMTGVIAQTAPVEGGFVDVQCVDGRSYKTCCIALWSHAVTGLVGAYNSGWGALPSATFSVTFLCPVTVLFVGGSAESCGFRFYVDGVLTSGAGVTTPTSTPFPVFPVGGSKLFNLAAGTHVFTFEYHRDSIGGANVAESTCNFIAFGQGSYQA